MSVAGTNAAGEDGRRPRRSWAGLVVLIAVALLVVRWIDIEVLGHWEVRLDSGDLRRCGYVFASYRNQLPPEYRTPILTAARELGIPPEWHRALPSAPSNGDYGNRVRLYTHVACWLREEPGLGKILLSRLTEYTRNPHGRTGQADELALLWYVRYDSERQTYVLDANQLENNESLTKQLAEIGYAPRPGGLLEQYAHRSATMFDGYAQVLVDTVTSQGGSKYHWQHARVLKVIQCDARWTIGPEIDFAHIYTIGDVPDGQQVLYLEHFDGPPEWWRLFKYESSP